MGPDPPVSYSRSCGALTFTAWKVPVFRVIRVRIFPHSDQNNSECGHFSRRDFQWQNHFSPGPCLSLNHLTESWRKVQKQLSREMFLGPKGVLKICIKFTGEHLWKAISINFQSNFIEIKLWHGCSPVNLLHIFRTAFYNNNYRGLLL